MRINQKGFAVAEGLLILVIIGIISGVGYFVYHSQQEAKKSQDNSNKSSLEIDASKKSEDKPAETTPAKKYFEIKELGVKFEQPDSLKDLYYVMSDDGRFARFSLNEFKGTDCAADKIAQISLVKATEDDMTNDPYTAASKPNAQKLGDHYYFTFGGQAGCSQDTVVKAKVDKVLREGVVAATKGKLELIK